MKKKIFKNIDDNLREFRTPKDFSPTCKKGTIFIRGLHGVPDFYKNDDNELYRDENFWWWVKDSGKEDHGFITSYTVDEHIKPKRKPEKSTSYQVN